MPPLFPSSFSSPGHGNIHITLLPPSIPSFSTLSYTYPLKLLPSTPHVLVSDPNYQPVKQDEQSVDPTSPTTPPTSPPTSLRPNSVPLVFVVTYGGGLLAGDRITLNICLDSCTRLTVATQGSTRVYKIPLSSPEDRQKNPAPNPVNHENNSSSRSTLLPSPSPGFTSRQDLHVRIGPNAGLWLAPDPIQPFADSLYAQNQIFEVENGASVGIIDWVTEGRRARGESWDMNGWKGRNEIWAVIPTLRDHTGQDLEKERKFLMVRDSVILEPGRVKGGISMLVANAGVFGTLLFYGPLFASLSAFFLSEFISLPRIGERNWNADHGDLHPEHLPSREKWRRSRIAAETSDGVLWTAGTVRGGVTVVKFSAREVQGARDWLGGMLKEEGSVRKEFGDGGLMFVRG